MRMSRPTARLMLVAWTGTLATALVYLALGVALDDARAGYSPSLLLGLAALAGAVVAGLVAAVVVPLGARRQGEIENEVRHAVVDTVLRLGPARLLRERAGRIVSTATDAGERVGLNRGTFSGPALASVTSPVVVTAMIAFLDRSTALWLLAAAILPPLVIGAFQKVFRTASANYRQASRRLAAAFLDSIQGLTTLRLLRAGETRAHELDAASQEVRRAVMRMLLGNQLVIRWRIPCSGSPSSASAPGSRPAASPRTGSLPGRASPWCCSPPCCWTRSTGSASSSTSRWPAGQRIVRCRRSSPGPTNSPPAPTWPRPRWTPRGSRSRSIP